MIQSISRKSIQAMSIRIFFVILITSGISYWQNFKAIRSRTISELSEYAKARADRESTRYALAETNLKTLDRLFRIELDSHKGGVEKEFNSVLKIFPDGAMRHVHNNDPFKTQIFINKLRPINSDIKRNVVVAEKLVSDFGKAWNSTFINLWIIGAEDYSIGFWPGVPLAMAQLPGDFSFVSEEYASIGFPKNNPGGLPIWTGIYFDKVSYQWMISINHPFYYHGSYQFSFGMDITMHELEERTVSEVIKGSYNIVFRDDGRLIVHPDFMKEIKESNGNYRMQDSKDSVLKSIYSTFKEGSTSVTFDDENDLFLAASKIKGPNWWYVIVYPESNLKSVAIETAISVGIIGLISLLIEILMLFSVIQNTVMAPIKKIIQASNMIAAGDPSARVEINTNDEFGQMASSFNAMADRIMERDKALVSQAKELELLVIERTNELDTQKEKAFQAAKMAILGEMAGGIAHEINNPLTIISLNTETARKQLMRNPSDFAKIDHHLLKVERTVDRISKIVKGMKAFSRNAEQDPKEKIQLESIIDKTLSLCEENIKGHRIQLICGEIPQAEIFCRESEIIQVLLNLIQNSIDALESSSDKWISFKFETNANLVKIIFEDSGRKIPDHIADKMMNPFFTTKEVGKGTGLGLFISLGLIESNAGKLYFNRKSERTQFVIEF